MATVTKTIGTSSRDYSTIVAWEADLADASIYADTNDAVGVMYADSTFTDATVTINGGTSIGGSAGQDLASITLTVHADSRHDGTKETGALLKPTANSGHDVGIIRIDRDNVTIEWLDISLDSLDSANTNKAIVLTGTNDDNIIRNNLIHDKGGNPGSNGPHIIHAIGAGASSDTISILNNIIYNIVETNNDSAVAVNLNAWSGTSNVYNNTIYKVTCAGSSKAAAGIIFGNPSSAVGNIKNNIVSLLTVVGASTLAWAYSKSSASSTANTANNLSDDTTHATYDAEDMRQSLNDSSALIGKTLAEISFVSTGVGSEDLHIDSDSDCVDAGVDLGTTNGVNTDINGRDRDGEGDTWDIGAHEFVPEATAGAAFLLFLD